MRRFGRFLVTLFTGCDCGHWKCTNPVMVPPTTFPVASWEMADKDNFSRFIHSTTGLRLVTRLRAYEAENAKAGAKDILHTAHSAGRSVGYGDCVNHLLSLVTAYDRSNDKVPAPRQETPQEMEAREMAELLERVTP